MKLRKIFLYSTAILLALLVAAAGWLYHEATSLPVQEPLPLPASLIALSDPAGQALMDNNPYLADYDHLQKYFESQIRPAYCGVASSVAVLNALADSKQYSQNHFFNDKTEAIRSEYQVSFGGMTLDELNGLLRTYNVQTSATHASDINLDQFRHAAMANLATSGDYLLINYSRAPLGQGYYGHISPLAGYDEETDRFLILDVTTYHYPPVWVEARTLWEGMQAVDSSSGKSRGFVEVTPLRPDTGF